MDWTRACISLERFEGVADVHLDMLEQQTKKINSLNSQGLTDNVRRERTNVERIIRQLVNDFQQINAIGHSLSQQDRDRFEFRLRPLRNRIQIVLQQYHDTTTGDAPKAPATKHKSWRDADVKLAENEKKHSGTFSWDDEDSCYYAQSQQTEVNECMEMSQQQEQLKKRAESALRDAEAHERIAQEIDELQEIMTEMASLVHQQHDQVDSIEANVENAQENLLHGEKDLKKSAKYKAAQYPLAGAAVGAAAAGGPVGLLIGVKVAAVAAVGGAVAGFMGGRFFKAKTIEEPVQNHVD